MRIDKYLWCVRYYKTRTMATTACKKGHVRVNQDIVKPSREVYAQDIIELRKDQINYKLTVNDIPESRVGAKLVDIYRTDTTPKEQFEAQEWQLMAPVNLTTTYSKDRTNLIEFEFAPNPKRLRYYLNKQ